jgi:hypothetical protein
MESLSSDNAAFVAVSEAASPGTPCRRNSAVALGARAGTNHAGFGRRFVVSCLPKTLAVLSCFGRPVHSPLLGGPL